ILSSSLISTPPTSLESYLLLFNSNLTTILDNHAPVKSVTCSSRPHHRRNSFITEEILSDKSKRSKLETIFRRSKTPDSLANFKLQAKKVVKLISTAKRTYYQILISQCAKKPKKLWSTLQSLLSLNPPSVLPTSISSSTMA